jgi:hypothetical protein
MELCERCGEFLPHYCAALVTFHRRPYATRRSVTIVDRDETAAACVSLELASDNEMEEGSKTD